MMTVDHFLEKAFIEDYQMVKTCSVLGLYIHKLLIQYFVSVVNCLNLVHFLLPHVVTEIEKI